MNQHELLIFGVAKQLGDELLDQIAFVGGATVSLHLDSAQPGDIRSTKDVDFIVSVSGYNGYQNLATTLREKGFREDSNPSDSASPLCRFTCNDILVDVMPDDEKVLGFSNPWFEDGKRLAITKKINDISIKVVPAVYLLATKLAALEGRGNGCLLGDKDADDIMTLINGRDSLEDEINSSKEDVRNFIKEKIIKYIKSNDFESQISGNLIGEESERYDIVYERFQRIAGRG